MIVFDILLVFLILFFAVARPNNEFSHVSTRLGWSYCTLFKLGVGILAPARPLLRGWSAFVHAPPLLGRSTWPPIRPRPNAEPSVEHGHLSVRNQTLRICWKTSFLYLNFLFTDSLCLIMPGHIKKTTGLFSSFHIRAVHILRNGVLETTLCHIIINWALGQVPPM